MADVMKKYTCENNGGQSSTSQPNTQQDTRAHKVPKDTTAKLTEGVSQGLTADDEPYNIQISLF